MNTQTDEVQAAIKAWQSQEHDDVYEYKHNNHILCPNCGYESKGYTVENDGDIFSCGRCEANFRVTVDIAVTYSTA